MIFICFYFQIPFLYVFISKVHTKEKNCFVSENLFAGIICEPEIQYTCITSPPLRTWITMAEPQTRVSNMTSTVEMWPSSSATPVETQLSTDDRVTINKFQDKSDAWRDAKMWPPGMETILRKEEFFNFLWETFSYLDEEIDEAISKYDAGST